MKKEFKRQFRFNHVQLERLEMVVEKMNEKEPGATYNMTDAINIALGFYSRQLGIDEEKMYERLEAKGYKFK